MSNKHLSDIAECSGVKMILDKGESVCKLKEGYGIGNTTIYEYDIKKQHEKLLEFYTKSDSNKDIASCKTMHRA